MSASVPGIDASGRWRSHAPISLGVAGFYVFLLGLLVLFGREPTGSILPSPLLILAAILLVFFARYASTRYEMDSDYLWARRLFGSRRLRLDAVRRIEAARLRELSPTGFFGGWGWRGRVWSPLVGPFDSVHTLAEGVMVHGDGVPLFVSPKDPAGFIRELSRRARSYHDSVEVAPRLGSETGR